MKLVIVGSGYVGLVTGACFAEMGNQVTCVDIDSNKIDNLKKGIVPIYEPGLEDLVLENFKTGTLRFTTDLKEALKDCEIVFIAVGTPMGEDGSADLQYVLQVATDIGKHLDHDIIVVDKSTVPVGTAEKVQEKIQAEQIKRKTNFEVHVVSNPEFLKEGNAIRDFQRPDRVVVGAESETALVAMKELYRPFTYNHERFISMDVKSAEMTKYAANCMLATKISFMNEISNICERVGADINKVRVGIGSDSRIGYSFIYPGCGFGGSCFPKDLEALIHTSREYGFEPEILVSVENRNAKQKHVIAEKVIKRFGKNLSGLIFTVWGLAFKPETDDMRDSSSKVIIDDLTTRGAKVKAYDPKAINEAKNHYLKDNANVEYFDSKYSALSDADALIIVTEWKEFRAPDFEEIKKQLQTPIIFDGRNIYDQNKIKELGFEYFCIGVRD